MLWVSGPLLRSDYGYRVGNLLLRACSLQSHGGLSPHILQIPSYYWLCDLQKVIQPLSVSRLSNRGKNMVGDGRGRADVR